MDKYQGMYRVQTNLTDNTDYRRLCYANQRGKESLGDQEEHIEKIDQPYGTSDVCDKYLQEYQEPAYEVDCDSSANSIVMGDILSQQSSNEDGVVIYRSSRGAKRGYFFGAFVRVMVSALLFCSIFAVSRIKNPICSKITDFVKQAITYDLDTNQDKELGEITAISLIKENNQKTEQEEE